jgi:gamma-glutamyltranspeptidase/glutathione hydrolase
MRAIRCVRRLPRPVSENVGRFFVCGILVWLVCTGMVIGSDWEAVQVRRGMVVSAHPLASEVGIRVLKDGGSAVDAAVSGVLVLNVVEGYFSGIGGGLFIVIRTPKGEVVAIDGRETAPAMCDSMCYLGFPLDQKASVTGAKAGGVPGALAAMDLGLKKYGTWTLAEVLAPAIAIADTGFFIYPVYEKKLGASRERLLRYPQTAAIFLRSDSSVWKLGDRLVQEDLAETFRTIAQQGVDVFYHGELGKVIAGQIEEAGGWIRMEDLEWYRPVVREAVHGSYKDYEVYSMPPPSSGGVHLIQMLNILSHFRLARMGHNSPEYIHYLTEAMIRAFADRAEYLGDPAFCEVPVEGLLSLDYADALARSIHPHYGSVVAGPGDPFRYQEGDHTTHISVIDSMGWMVAVTATVNTTFGSAWVIPGTGILLNNEMDDFVTRPGEANFWGLVGNRRNCIEPRKRPLSSMTPTLVLKDNEPFMVLGSPGGPRIISTVLQVLLNVVEFGMNIQAAVDAPRVHHQWRPDTLYIEERMSEHVLYKLGARGYHVMAGDGWSSAQCIYRDPMTGVMWGGSDRRSGGAAMGY